MDGISLDGIGIGLEWIGWIGWISRDVPRDFEDTDADTDVATVLTLNALIA